MGKRGPTPMPIRIRGKLYADASAAARDLRVSVKTVHSANNRGTLDRIGTRPSKPFMGFPSKTAASIALGKEVSYVSSILTKGSKRRKIKLMEEIYAYKVKHGIKFD